MKIVSNPFGYGDDKVAVEEVSVTYTQAADTNSDSDEIQAIKFTTQYSWPDKNEEFPFYVNIQTLDNTHWSTDNPQELVDLFNDFKQRVINKKD